MNSHKPVEDPDFIVASAVMRKFMGMVERMARHVGTVLIVGETGTGKERIAHSIHEHSLRREHSFVDINCAALPEHLVESELFGYEKGAFSGANAAKIGLFELAHKGTIFLDEIGELDLKVQVKLLRVLDRAPYYRLGGNRKITADVRVVAATNRNLKEEVRAGRFRKDLYHRLSQFELCVPPLRERPDDIVALAEHLLTCGGASEGTGPGLRFSPEALLLLRSYSWPGNVRELQNVVNKVLFSAPGPLVGAADVRQELTNAEANEDEQGFQVDQGPDHRPDNESEDQADYRPDYRPGGLKAQAIHRALEETGGHRGHAAAQLGISRRTLSRKLRNYGLSTARHPAPAGLSVNEPEPGSPGEPDRAYLSKPDPGSLSEQERQHYRAEISVPASLVTADGVELNCTTHNLGASGMGLQGLTTVLHYRCDLRVRFCFPDSDKPIEVVATLAWTDKQGCAGILFKHVAPTDRHEMDRWLSRRMTEEGWAVSSVSPEPLAV